MSTINSYRATYIDLKIVRMNILTTKPGDREITLPLNKLQRTEMHAKMFGVFLYL